MKIVGAKKVNKFKSQLIYLIIGGQGIGEKLRAGPD
jgi:hypothetical protein